MQTKWYFLSHSQFYRVCEFLNSVLKFSPFELLNQASSFHPKQKSQIFNFYIYFTTLSLFLLLSTKQKTTYDSKANMEHNEDKWGKWAKISIIIELHNVWILQL